MRVLVRRKRAVQGTSTFTEVRIEAPSLRIGRGTAQDLEIADPRVALQHAEILRRPDGSWVVEAKTASGVWLNGALANSSLLRVGDVLEFGLFKVSVLSPEAGTDLSLSIQEPEAHPRETAEPIPLRTRLEDTRLSRRALAWSAATLVLLSMLLSPLLLRYGITGAEPLPTPLSAVLPTDRVWNSGEISSTHAYFETDCATCHVQPFERVRNDACLGCHDSSRHHAINPELAAAPDFADAKCTDCHREHNGHEGTIVRLASLCTDCHADPSARFPGSDLSIVRNFSEEHPPFSPRVAHYDEDGNFQFRAVRQGSAEPLQEDTGLHFPHDIHVAAQGVDAPEGTRVLECADCHVPDLGRISFEPVRMEAHCADCHRLEFDPDDPSRVLPHGKPDEVAAVLRDHFAARALSGQVKALDTSPLHPSRRRPGPVQPPAPQAEAARWSEQQGEQAVREVFEGRVCSYCHVVDHGGDAKGSWNIAPLALTEHAMRGARFTHKPHMTAACGDCHEAQDSKSSADVLLPGIENCRACHGDDGGSSQVSSACIDCHGYHAEDAPLWDPLASKRKLERKTSGSAMHKTAATGEGS